MPLNDVITKQLLSYGIGGIFVIYLISINWLFLMMIRSYKKDINNLNRKYEVGTEKTVGALSKISEALAAIKGILYSRGRL